jgi:glycosyltransferase involved in cell wall biosynthesis
VDPLRVEEIARGLETLMESEGLREELARRGREHAAGFTWEKAVEKTFAAYRELLGG